MRNRYTNNINFKISFSGMMLGLMILFQFLEKFMPIGGLYMSMNISIIFVVASIYITGYWWAILLLILRFAIGPAVGLGYDLTQVWSHTILLISGFIYMNLFIIFHRYVFRKLDSKLNLLLTGVITIISSSLIMAMLNGVILSPIYWQLLGYTKHPSISEAKTAYSYVYEVAFLGIPNYWAGMLTAFGLGNLAKYTVTTICFIALWKVVKHYEEPFVKGVKNEK